MNKLFYLYLYILVLTSFKNVFLNGQIVPNSAITTLTIKEAFEQPYVSNVSRSWSKCYYDLYFIVVNSDPTDEITTVRTSLRSPNLRLKDGQSNLYYMQVYDHPHGTFQYTIEANSTKGVSVLYSIHLNCLTYDLNLVELNLNVNPLPGLSPALIVSSFDFKNFPGKWISGVSETTISTVGLNTNSYYVIWPAAIVQNNFDQNWTNTINITSSSQTRYFVISIKSLYSDLPTEEVTDISVYPPTNNVQLTGIGYSPLVTFISNSNSSTPFLKFFYAFDAPLRAISGSKGSIKYIAPYYEAFGDGTTTIKYNLSYQTGATPTISPYDFSKIYKRKFIIPAVPALTVYNYSDSYIPLFTVQFSGPTINYLNSYSVTLLEFDLMNPPKQNFPFGFSSGNNLNLIYKAAFPQRLKEFQVSKVRIGTGIGLESIQTVPQNELVVINIPKITSYQFTKIYNSIHVLRIVVKDPLGIAYIYVAASPFPYAKLVSGTIYDGEYELLVHLFMDVTIIIENTLRGANSYQNGTFISLNPPYQFLVPSYLNEFISFSSFKNVSFLENNLNLNNQSSYNVLYFNTSDFSIDKPMFFSLADPISVEKRKIPKMTDYFPIVYNETLKMFNCKFIVPKNNLFGNIPYTIISVNQLLGGSFENPVPLTVASTYLDNYGPIFANIEKVPSDSVVVSASGMVGWRFTIEDEYNGFDRGYVKVMGSVDSSYYHFNFSFGKDEIGGDVWNGRYDILFPVTDTCFEQDYVITQVYLYDTNGIVSEFGSSADNLYQNPTSNPFIKYIGDERANRITVGCTLPIPDDISPPELIDFTVSTNQNSIDVGSSNRLITFNFEARDLDTGLKDYQTPVVYVTSRRFEFAECVSNEIFSDTTNKKFECTIELSIGFGFPGLVTYSVYGFINNGGHYSGFTSKDLKDQGFQYYSNITYSFDDIIINQVQPFTSEGGQLIIYGKGLNNADSLQVSYGDEGGLNFNNTYPIYKSSSSFLIVNNIKPTNMPFKIIAAFGLVSLSNEITVNPIYYNINYPPPTLPPVTTETPTTPSPTPTLPPVTTETPTTPAPIDQCLGEPKCGGPTQGYCNSETGGCVCISPWVGTSCSSQVIVVPKPDTNTTDPTTAIPIVPGTSNSNVFYKSLISLVSLRELNFNQDEVKLFTFEQWLFSEIDENKNKYETNITTTGNGGEPITTNITVVIEWFKDVTIVEFAGSNLTMNPSTIKYTIDITEYAFSSSLNQLQLITSALFESDSDKGCSSKEFGSNLNGDDSNFVKIQIQDHSLYGRFIKRAIIDDKITTISNTLLDSSLNVVASPSVQQTFIGITIPNYKSKITLDPDFSVLLDSNSVSNDNDNSVCNSPSSGLTTPQLAGIVVGSVAFAAVAAIIGAYFIVQKRKDNKFLSKMNSLNSR